MKNILFCMLVLACVMISFSGCRDSSHDTEVNKCLDVEMVTGSKKQIKVTILNYADLAVYESRGGYRLSTWEYDDVFGYSVGFMKTERTLKNGVVDFKEIKCP